MYACMYVGMYGCMYVYGVSSLLVETMREPVTYTCMHVCRYVGMDVCMCIYACGDDA